MATARPRHQTGAGTPRAGAGTTAALPPQNSTAVSAPSSASALPPTCSTSHGRAGAGTALGFAGSVFTYAATARASPGVSRENHGHGIAIGSSRRPSRPTPRVTAATISSSVHAPRPVAASDVRLRLYHTPHGYAVTRMPPARNLLVSYSPVAGLIGVWQSGHSIAFTR